MKKNILLFILMTFIFSCKKDNNNSSITDITGTYRGSSEAPQCASGAVMHNQDDINITGSGNTYHLTGICDLFTESFTASLSNNTLTLPYNSLNNHPGFDFMSGTASISGNTLTINYTLHVIDNGGAVICELNCSGVYTKQ